MRANRRASRRLLYLFQFPGAQIVQNAFHQRQHLKEPRAASLDGDLQIQSRDLESQLHVGSSPNTRKKGEVAGDVTMLTEIDHFNNNIQD